MNDLAAFVLAGGRSSRMGCDKAFVEISGRPLLSIMLELARSITADTSIVGAARKFGAFAPVIEDQFEAAGPLAAIHAALSATRKELNLILAVDLPCLEPGLLHFLADRARNCSAVVTVPRAGGCWQPLCAVYRRQFSAVAYQALQAGSNKIDLLFEHVALCGIDEEELANAGFSAGMFRNVNTPNDLEEAQRR